MTRWTESMGYIDSACDCYSAWFEHREQTSESKNLFFYRIYTRTVFL